VETTGGFHVAVEDDSGRSLPTYFYGGQVFVLGSFGDRYRVRIENRTGRRVEAVLTVDGRDAVSGERGSYAGRGYLVPAHGSVVVDGFRQSLSSVAAFRFTSPSGSYSSRMGSPENVGVIGVAFFREAARPPQKIAKPRPRRDHERAAPRSSKPSASQRKNKNPRAGAAAPEASAPSTGAGRAQAESRSYDYDGYRRYDRYDEGYYYDGPRDNLGTEYGEDRYSPVAEVPFRRANPSRPDRVVTLRYDDASGLQARGIDVYPDYPDYDWASWRYRYRPDPFPNTADRRFAPPPP
jgi:hypothetical protein